jgi:pimeloyl-ACP methyl ester carboxylesterase
MEGDMLGWLAIAAAFVLGVPATMYFAQDSLLFLRQPFAGTAPVSQGDRLVESLEFEASDGARLRGWLVKPAAIRAPLLVYYGGNAEEVSWQAHDPSWPTGWSLAIVNYRGYGASDGVPSERALFADALLVFDTLIQRPDVDPARVVLVGRSLGSGIATFVAYERSVAGVILVSPYDSMVAVAGRHYPWLPVSLLLKHPFDSHSRAPRIHAPLMAIVGERDTIIPPTHSRKLFQAWAGSKSWIGVPEADHNDISAAPTFSRAIATFLNELGRDRN